MIYTREDLKQEFGKFALLEAEDFHAFAPLSPSVMRNGEIITNIIHGPKTLRIYIRNRVESDGALSIRGECNCGGGSKCVHIVASLLAPLQQAAPDEPPPLSMPAANGKTQTPEERRCLLYILHPEKTQGQASVEVVSSRIAKSGEVRSAQPYNPRWVHRPNLPRYIGEEDLALLQQLSKLEPRAHNQRYPLHGYQGAQILARLLESDRCRLQQTDRPLKLGNSGGSRLEWRMDEQGNQSPHWVTDPNWIVLDLQPQWYLDLEKQLCGPLETAYSLSCLQWLQKHAAIRPEDSSRLLKEMQELFSEEQLPLPRLLRIKKVTGKSPTPIARFIDKREIEDELYNEYGMITYFDYKGYRVPGNDLATHRLVEDGQVIEIQRNRNQERKQLEGIDRDSLVLEEDKPGRYLFYNLDDAIQFQQTSIPKLRKKRWRFEYPENFAARLLEVKQWQGELQPHSDERGWFDLSLGIDIEGARINLLPILLDLAAQLPSGRARHQLLDSDQELRLTLDEGVIAVPFKRVRPILETVLELYEEKETVDDLENLSLSRIQLMRLGDLGGDVVDWQEEMEELALVEKLRGVNEIPVAPPPQGLQASLRDYQQQGLNWLQFLREHHLAGVLADDMGLGKTLQTLCHILKEKEEGRLDRPCMVVAPTSLMGNWKREAARFTPDLKVLVLHGPQRKQHFERIADHDLVLTTYPLLSRDGAHLGRHGYHMLVLDEAQVVKNDRSQAARQVRKLQARHRLCLTGTPLENHLGELWSLFDFLLPGFLGNSKLFRRIFRNPVEKEGDDAASRRLARRIRPFLLRRTKQEVASELPPKTEMIRSVELEEEQRDLYESIRLAVHHRVKEEIADKGLARSSIIILDALTKLRQVCCDPRLVKLDSAREVTRSAKLEMLMELLPEMIEEGRKVLLFSQFTTMLGLIEAEVKKAGIDYAKLTGQTRNRAEQIDKFQLGDAPLFLISLKAGGVGLNLTAADTVIHYDPWWNPAVERQATDRAHRIGQQNPVFVYKLISEGTVEEKIQAMQERKQKLADAMLDQGEESGPRWSEADLEMLFEALPEG